MTIPIPCEGGFSQRSKYDALELKGFMGSMADYPKLQFSMKSVQRAGKRLAKDIIWNQGDQEDILKTFAIANSWRDSHVYPMRSVRISVIQRMRHNSISGFTAARPKRMSSIRKKLKLIGCQLDQMNDIAGCRAVLDDIQGVNDLITHCRNSVPHDLRQEYPYIDEPKADGYRSHHLVFRFRGKNENATFDGRRVELQIRTRLQHSWATAVEAVGLFRGEDMKAGQGDARWLRLFKLMSSEFAHAENCPITPGVSGRHQRIDEIRELNSRLNAAVVLENLKIVANFVENYIHETGSRYYLIRYDHEKHEVSVHPYSNAVAGSISLGEVEHKIEVESVDAKVVLVEVEKIDQLMEAYPNYFGDVTLFVRNLNSICKGDQAIEYNMAPQRVLSPKINERPDPSWLRPRHRRWE